MTTPKPTLLWVHGAWHTTEYLQPTVALLAEAGYTSVCVQLPSVGADPPLLTAERDVSAVRRALFEILDEKKQNVMVVMHSYGGAVGSSAAKGFAKAARQAEGKNTWITGMCYIAANIGSEGERPHDMLGFRRNPGDPIPPFYVVKTGLKEGGGVGADLLGGPGLLYGDLDEEDKTKYTALLKHHSIFVFDCEIEYDAIYEIPSSYLICTMDQALPTAIQEQLLEKARSPPHEAVFKHVERIPSGHTPFVGKHAPAVRDFIRRAAGEDIPTTE